MHSDHFGDDDDFLPAQVPAEDPVTWGMIAQAIAAAACIAALGWLWLAVV